MSFIRIASTSGIASTASTPINTTGADLLIIWLAYDTASTPSDSKGNTWTPLTVAGVTTLGRFYYCRGGTVGSSHTFSQTETYGSISVVAYSGSAATPFDRMDYTNGSGTSFNPGPIATTQDNELILAGLSLGNGTGAAIDSGFSLVQSVNAVPGTNYGNALAEQIQTTSASPSPTWLWTGASTFAAAYAVFKAASGPVPATAITLSGPTSGLPSVASSNFTAGANGTITGSVVVTPNDSSGGGAFTPTTVTISAGSPSASFTYTPSSAGAKTINVTNNGGLSNPAGRTYTAAAASTLSSAAVDASGAFAALTFSGATPLAATDIAVTVDGNPMAISAVSGAGATWSAAFGSRWIRASAFVQVTYAGSTIAATNSSTLTTAQIGYVGRGFGMFVHFNTATFNNVEQANGTEPLSNFAPSTSMSTAIDQWVAGAKSAGMQYLVLTAKHHDGLCLWPTATASRSIANTPWYAANGSPNILVLFCQKVRAAGLGVGIYYNPWDAWWQSQNPGWTGAQLQDLVDAQLAELLGGTYGAIDLMWYDEWAWAAGGGISYTQLPFAAVYARHKGLQPNCVFLLNNHEHTVAHSEIDVYEIPFESTPPAGRVFCTEACDTIRNDNKWFSNPTADTGKTVTAINATLAALNANRSSYLLNCPPDTSGRLPVATMATLAAVGALRLEIVRKASTATNGPGFGGNFLGS